MPYRICVSIGSVPVDECISIIKTSKMAELRLDLIDIGIKGGAKVAKLENKVIDNIKKLFSGSNELIATCRANKGLDDEKRFKILSYAIDSGAKYVDVELDSSDDFKERMIKKIKASDSKLIISYHNCEKTPSRQELLHTLEWCKSYKPDVIKIACLSRSKQDNARLLGLLDSDVPMIVIGMGEEGKTTRFVAPLFGAFCTFVSPVGYAGTAPGQVTTEELETFLKAYKG